MHFPLTLQIFHIHTYIPYRHLEDRERLAERVRDLEARLFEKDNDNKLLVRRLQLESKNFKGQLQQEVLKQREIAQKLERAHHEIQRLSSVIEVSQMRNCYSYIEALV